MSLRRIIDLVESSQLLLEHIVTNPEAIEAYVDGFAKDVTHEAGKMWFKKTLRKALFNDDTILSHMNHEALNARELETLPDYAKKAIENGEDIYAFVPENPDLDDLSQRLAHIVDWFNSLHEVASRESSNAIEKEDAVISSRMLGKLLKMNLDQIEKVSEEWFARMGSRVSKVKSIEGGEILHEWPNGYYAIRYTSKTTMMQDGQDLQNCLRSGTYWAQVADGSQMVIGIRKPNDEAVVGMRIYVGEKKLAEAKGKNNKPVSSDYVGYVVDLINKLNVDASGNEDLKNSGIVMHNGRAGSFEDVAELVFDESGVKLWKAGNQFRGAVGNAVVDGAFRLGGLVGAVIVDALDIRNPGAIPPVLNAFTKTTDLPVSLTASLRERLERSGIFFKDGRFGTIAEVGEPVNTTSTHDLYRLVVNGEDDLIFAVGKADTSVVRMELNDSGMIHSVAGARDVENLSDLLNASGRKPAFYFEKAGLFDQRIFFNGKTYGPIEEVGQVFVKDHDVMIYTLRKARLWVAKSGNEDYAMFKLTGSMHRFDAVSVHGNGPKMLRAARSIIEHEQPELLEKPERFGVVALPDQVITNRVDFFKRAHDIRNYFQGENYNQFDHDQKKSDSMQKQVSSFVDAEAEREPFSVEDAEKILEIVGASGKTFVLDHTDTATIYDMSVKSYDLYLPWARIMVADGLPFNPKDDIVVKDMRQGLIDAKEWVEKNPGKYKIVDMTYSYAKLMGLEDEMRALRATIEASMENLKNKVEKRLENPDEFATDLSSRFAAMNAKRKLS